MTEVIRLVRQGSASMYPLSKDDIHIPTPLINGSLPNTFTPPRTFTAYINKQTGILRIDCLDRLEFWMEINLGSVMEIEKR